MNPILRMVLLSAILVYFSYIHQQLRRKRIDLKHILLWIFGGVLMLIWVIFPQILQKALEMLGIMNYLNGLFSAIIFGLIILSMRLTIWLSELGKNQRTLVQEQALLEQRLRKLEGRLEGEE